MREKKLTEKQNRFIDYYIELGDATKAAIEAGYSKKTAGAIGHENLKKLENHIAVKIREKDAARIASQDEVLQFLTSVLRGEKLEQTNVFFGEVSEIEGRPAPKERLKAAEMLARRYGLDKPQNDTHSDGHDKTIVEAIRETPDHIFGTDLALEDDDTDEDDTQ